MTPPDDTAGAGTADRAAEGVSHLQAAAREMISAARALLDAAEALVDDPDAVRQAATVVTGFARAAGQAFTTPGARPAPAADADDDGFERIDVS